MSQPYDIMAFRQAIGPIKSEDNPVLVRQKSRDFYWYSPVLKRELDHVAADIVVTPQNENEVVETLKAAHHLKIPVTPRGSGTGNYGQAMPLAGGIVLNLAEMNKVRAIRPGRVIAEPGAILAKIDGETRASGQELRMYPSTYATASIGGFVAGGSGGVGSINWGGLRDFGNILRLRVLTMEAAPRALELTGEDLHKAAHAYGTNGIIAEVEMALAAAYDWIDLIVGFDTFEAAASYANTLGEEDGLLTKLITVVAAPVPHDYFLRHRKFLPAGKSVVLIMVAEHALDALRAFNRRYKNAETLFDATLLSAEDRKGLSPNYELSWNHTTLRALRVDPAITYLQALYPFPGQLAAVKRIHDLFGQEVMGHLEFVR
ncbi:MAG TPA: FAD-binding oxidoreductase, partial [Roseiarcus sp.]|nr:FAD-binding oxidoreductase [Roseiarcus sp.]